MQRTIKLTIAFDGTNYSGWQRQKNANTIQQEIEKNLSAIHAKQIDLHGAGRTDAGVHAIGMTAHFITEKDVESDSFKRALNSMLPKDIRITDCQEKKNDFHARYCTTGKQYKYHLYTGTLQLPHERLYCVHMQGSLNLPAMQKCLSTLIGTHDFTTFETVGSRDLSITNGRGAVRTITTADIEQSGDHYCITLQGDGFLRYMVRNIVGTLIQVGTNKRTAEDFEQALMAKDRNQRGLTAPAHGLFLEKVFY